MTIRTNRTPRKKATTKAATVRNNNVVTLTLKQAQTIQNMLLKANRTSKVLDNKINTVLG